MQREIRDQPLNCLKMLLDSGARLRLVTSFADFSGVQGMILLVTFVDRL